MGFPTVNVVIPETRIVVRRGVYVSRIRFGGTVLYGVTNVGKRPTVEQEGRDIAETFIFDFDEDIYGAVIEVELLHFLRPETAFDSVDALKKAVDLNKAEAAAFISENFI
jgi:riboflavin kinase/FMN adenylyltransferase